MEWDTDEAVFDTKVLACNCWRCGASPGEACTTRSGRDMYGAFSAKYHMDRVYAAYPSKGGDT